MEPPPPFRAESAGRGQVEGAGELPTGSRTSAEDERIPPGLLTLGPVSSPSQTRGAAAPTVGPQLEGPEHQAPLTYFPWPQPLSTLPASTLQYQPPAPALPGPQFVQLPISIPEPVLQDTEDPRRAINSLTIDKLLLEEEDGDAYALNHTLSVEGF
uniref:POU domain class 2-associating factor 1-like n=1 Tax=Panthera onca TaxID=9690 RepID=UPI0029541091|nr:POU domain class 2-associating factor 1-like [Panthera onca]